MRERDDNLPPTIPGRRRGAVDSFLGDSPLRVVVKLALLSVLVGMVMHFFGWSPRDVAFALRDAAFDIWDMGFGAFDSALAYLLLGAAVVVPAFLILRLLTFRR